MRTVNKEEYENNTSLAKSKLDELYTKTDIEDLNDIKRSNNYVEWIHKKTDIIIKEPTYTCSNEDKIKRGSVVWIEFGFNIGSEFGGKHPAIILRKSGDLVFVVPLSSQKPERPQKYHVRVNKVYNFSDRTRWVNVLNLQKVSIQRIDMSSSIGNVKGSVLDAINEALTKAHIF